MGFRLATVDGRAVLIDGADWHDLSAASGGSFSGDPMEAIERHAELHDVARSLDGRDADGAVEGTTFGPPIPASRNVFAIGLNYADHAAEAQQKKGIYGYFGDRQVYLHGGYPGATGCRVNTSMPQLRPAAKPATNRSVC